MHSSLEIEHEGNPWLNEELDGILHNDAPLPRSLYCTPKSHWHLQEVICWM